MRVDTSRFEATQSGRDWDLDHLAGTWSEADAGDFEEATAGFEEVDAEAWR